MLRTTRSQSAPVDPPSLDARPKAETPSIEDLVDHARRGRLRVPRFQRPLKWQPDDARLLFDSIYRGYPIGTLLFWQKDAEAAIVQFGPVSIEAGAKNDAWWVVDGQQRLTSLVRVLLGSNPDPFKLWFDLDQHEFVKESRSKSEPDRFLPLTEVIDTERLHQWVQEHGLSPTRSKAAFRLNKRVREYAVPAYVVESANEDVLRGIFHRSNASGKALDEADVFDALHGARGGDEPTSFEAVAETLKDLGFGDVEESLLYRSLLAIQGLDAAGGKVPTSFDGASEAYARTARAMRAAIIFLTTHVGIPQVALLPYKQPLVALAKFFDLHSEPSARSRELLSRWIWRGAWSGLHSGDTVTTRAILDAIDGDENGSVQKLLATIRGAEPDPEPRLATYNFRTARSKLETLALLALRPRLLTTGKRIIPSSVKGPESILTLGTQAEDPLATTVAARFIHPRIPKVRLAIARADEIARVSQAIPQSAYEAFIDGDDESFLRLRATHLIEVVEEFLRSRAKWRENDRPPIGALRVRDED